MDLKEIADLSALAGRVIESLATANSDKKLGRELRLFSQDVRHVMAKPRRTALTKTRMNAARRAAARASRWSKTG